MKIGTKIRDLRLSKMMTQAELAGDLITRNMLSCIERNTAMPSLQTVLYLAERLRVPAGYLLAEEEEEFFYRKRDRISDIRIVFRRGEYRTCRALCTEGLGGGCDDEIAYLIAESDLEIAREEFLAGRLRAVCRYLDEAVTYCSKTVYRTNGIPETVTLFFQYLGGISATLYSEESELTERLVQEGEAPRTMDGLMAYLSAFVAFSAENFDEVHRYLQTAKESSYRTHMEACLLLYGGQYVDAEEKIHALREGGELPRVLLYHLTEQLEICCREREDFRAAYQLSGEKMQLLETLLREE